MAVDIIIPSPGESIIEVVLGPWLVTDGAWVEKDDPLVEIESDKVTLEIPAPETGLLSISSREGDDQRVGDAIGSVDPDATRPEARADPHSSTDPRDTPAGEVEVATSNSGTMPETPARQPATPLAIKIADAQGIDLESVSGTGLSGRVTKSDVIEASEATGSSLPSVSPRVASSQDEPPLDEQALAVPLGGSRGSRREKMSTLRQRIAERLLAAAHSTAMLTTFNDVDMTEIIRLRTLHKDSFIETHGVSLGFMSFFVHACTIALKTHPRVNAYVIGDEIEYHDFADISVAVGTPKGLVVPVLRNAEAMSFPVIERTIKDLAFRARNGKLTLEEMTGGTFTISNGGTFGSLMSTPILNPPQSGILGMHKIMNRPVEDPQNSGQVVIRPMMYLALSYDHRLVDGEEAVRFLVQVKECLESPERMLLGL